MYAAQQSTVAEVDLVFPRNETYKLSYPFPIIFAIQNPAIIYVPTTFLYPLIFGPIPYTRRAGFLGSDRSIWDVLKQRALTWENTHLLKSFSTTK